MATLTVATFDNDAVIFELEYNETNNKISLIRCIHNGSGNARGTLIDRGTDAIVAQAIFVPDQTTTIGIVGNYRVDWEEIDPETPDSPPAAILPYRTYIEYPVP